MEFGGWSLPPWPKSLIVNRFPCSIRRVILACPVDTVNEARNSFAAISERLYACLRGERCACARLQHEKLRSKADLDQILTGCGERQDPSVYGSPVESD